MLTHNKKIKGDDDDEQRQFYGKSNSNSETCLPNLAARFQSSLKLQNFEPEFVRKKKKTRE